MADRIQRLRDWYRLEIRAEAASEADLYIFDAIGKSFWDDDTVTAKKFVADLKALPKSVERIRVHVNSPGGDVFDAVTIANALREHPAEVHVTIEGLAASAATVVTMAGERITIAENALMMIHEPSSYTIGTAAEMRSAAEALDRIRDVIIATYRWHSQLPAERLGEMMTAVTWMNAEEALENGFATEIGAEVKAAAHFDPRILAKLDPVPAKYAETLRANGRDAMPGPDEKEEKPAAAARAGAAEVIDFEKAKAELEAGTRKRLESEWSAKEKELRTRLEAVRRVDLFADLAPIAREQGIPAAADRLCQILAASSGPEILTLVDPMARAAMGIRAAASPSEIYARRREMVAQARGERR